MMTFEIASNVVPGGVRHSVSSCMPLNYLLMFMYHSSLAWHRNVNYLLHSYIHTSAVGCSQVQSQDASCRPDGEDMRCTGSCPGSDELTGPTSAYQTCSKYLMWNEAMKQDQEPYNYPQCSGEYPSNIFYTY